MDTILTFDIGGSSIRAGLFDLSGELIRTAACPSGASAVAGDRAETDPESWWISIRGLAADVLGHADESVKGIAISGMTRTQIFLDAEANVLRPAITFRDGRAGKQAQRLKDLLDTLETAPDIGDRRTLSAYHPLARILWVKEHEPGVMDQTRWVLQPKDYLNFKLTGIACGDRISSFNLIDGNTGRVPGALFRKLDLDPAVLPELRRPENMVGFLKAGLPDPFNRLTGVPLFCSSMDGWCCALGVGANRSGFAYNVAGTTEVIGVVTGEPVFLPGLVTLPWGDGLYQIGGPTQAGGDCLTWYAETFSAESKGLLPEVAEFPEGAAGRPHHGLSPIFLPYLTGERAPIWDPRARGVFFGIHRSHTRKDFLRAVMEGVAFANRHILESAETVLPEPIKEIRISGGAAQSDAWCQVKADVSGYDVVRTAQTEAGLFGAALVVLHGLGIYKDIQTLQAELVREERRFLPDVVRRRTYRRMYGIYRSLYADLQNCFGELASIREELGGE